MLEVRTAGDPDEPETLFTDLSPQTMADMVTHLGTPVSAPTVREWLESLGMGCRKIEKSLAGGVSPDRDAQFCRIKELLEEHRLANNPVFSIDTKAKEHLGQLYREGRVRTESPFFAFDHDFPGWATGVVIPHGIYDYFNNRGHLNIGLDHDTGAFACDSFRWYWRNIGKWAWPGATSILWHCDCGGSNSASQYLFKEDLQRLASDLQLTIRVAHYPSYCSKYNPIERRFFPHVGRACRGLLFDTLETVVRLMKKTSTRTGLTATVNVLSGLYETGRKVAQDFKENIPLAFDILLPKWNYVATPQLR